MSPQGNRLPRTALLHHKQVGKYISLNIVIISSSCGLSSSNNSRSSVSSSRR